MMKDNSLIDIMGLAKINNNEQIFNNVDLQINQDDFVSIKGPSGCGKTTLLMIMAGLIKPDKGSIYLKNKLANSPEIVIPPHERGMNLLFQDLALWPHMTGFEQLKFSWKSSKIGNSDEQVDKICTDIGLNRNLLSKYPSQLSRGEQQRLAIARTFIAQTKIVMLDEPLTALDQSLRQQFMKYLNKIRLNKSRTIIIVSHDLMTDLLDYDQEIIFVNSTFKMK